MHADKAPFGLVLYAHTEHSNLIRFTSIIMQKVTASSTQVHIILAQWYGHFAERSAGDTPAQQPHKQRGRIIDKNTSQLYRLLASSSSTVSILFFGE